MDWFRPFNPDEAFIQSSVEISQVVGIQSKLVQDGCMQAFDMEPVGFGLAPQFIRFPNADTPLDAACGHPHGESPGVVIAAGSFPVLGRGLPAKFSTPHHEGFIQQSPLLQVFEQACNCLLYTSDAADE